MNEEMLGALDALEKEKGIKKEIVIEAIQAALISAYKRNYGQAQNVDVEFDQQSGNIHVYAVKKVVDEVADDRLEVSLADALKINRAYEVGDDIKNEVTPKNFGRISAQTAKQVIMQRLREAERSKIFNEYTQYEHEIIQGTVLRRDNKFIYVDLGDIEAVMGRQDQIPNEDYQVHDRIKVFVSRVENTTKGPQVFVSRSNPELVKRLFEQEIPEVYDGTVEIVSIAREAGDRSKVAVRSTNPNVDPVGTCVGPKGQRVQAIVNELNGENMDIVKWEEDPSDYIANALNPAEVIAVQFDAEKRECMVIVPDYQLSLAIGKRGQNARLAAKLTGFKIDIKPESEVEFVDDTDDGDEADNADTGDEQATATDDSAAPETAASEAADDVPAESSSAADADESTQATDSEPTTDSEPEE